MLATYVSSCLLLCKTILTSTFSNYASCLIILSNYDGEIMYLVPHSWIALIAAWITFKTFTFSYDLFCMSCKGTTALCRVIISSSSCLMVFPNDWISSCITARSSSKWELAEDNILFSSWRWSIYYLATTIYFSNYYYPSLRNLYLLL